MSCLPIGGGGVGAFDRHRDGDRTRLAQKLLTSPLLEALPSALNHRFDMRGDTLNGLPDGEERRRGLPFDTSVSRYRGRC